MTATKPTLFFVTSNQDKLRDALSMLSDLGCELRTKHIDLIEIQGEPVEIAKHKCLEALKIVGKPVIIEDSALCMEALGGMPGPYIKYFQKSMKTGDLHRLLAGFDNHKAHVISTVALAKTDENGNDQIRIFQSIVHGRIVAPRGTFGDRGGWDPVFLPDGSDLTYGEMSHEERQKFCARFGAFNELKKALCPNKLV